MEINTKDAGLDIISVRKNSYPAHYGNSGKYGQRRSIDSVRGRSRAGRPGRTGKGAGSRAPSVPCRIKAVKRRQKFQIQCAAAALGLVTLVILVISLIVNNHREAAAASGGNWKTAAGSGAGIGNAGGAGNASGIGNAGVSQAAGQMKDVTVQGIPAEEFALHPEWEENFLTPNEYSRPGDELKEVKNIFVHYTANPGTSAAQNRSYFERQKDEHLASVSSHFIIGYNGEIIQCVPLTEIAYAVQTRNFDSVSIECCYKAKDGSFTKETYQSLISLLAWLTDVYDLDTEDILRHYDCGGKKCPLYYTNHADKWKELKADVKKLKENAGAKL